MTSTRAPGSPTSWPASPTSRRRGCTSCCRGTGERPARTLLLPRQPDHGSTKLRVHHRPRRPNAWQGRGPPLRPRHATRTRRRSPLDLRHRRPRYTRVHRTRYREPQGAHPRSEAVSGASRPGLANRVPGRMDTKQELVGDFKNPGRELRPKGNPEPVRVHDFELPELGKVAPYGVYDLAANAGWVSVGVDADTAAFAVESIRRWWHKLGRARYPEAKRLVITADCGGSNGVRLRLWKRELQRFANETGLAVTVAHLPPGTSKWNRIEHRLFAYIS